MSKRRFEMYQYRNALVRMRQGDSDRDIARSKTMGRKKLAQVREMASEQGWLTPESILPDDAILAALFARKVGVPVSCVSTLEPWRELVTQWHAAGIQGATIHATLVRNHGYTGSYSSVHRFLKQLIALQVPDVPLRLTFKPAEAVQIDFGAGPLITDVYTGEIFKTWFFVMTLCWSRHQYAEFVRDQTVATWLGCHRRAFESFSGVPSRAIIDNAKCAITKACIHDPTAQRAYADCAESYDFKIDPCPPHDPQKKGIVESGVKYVKGNFLPLREFRSLTDLNEQTRTWVMTVAGQRIHGTTRQAPLSLFEVEKALMQALPVMAPDLGTWHRVTLHPDCHVKFDYSLYSAPFALVGKVLWLRATDNAVALFDDFRHVVTHAKAKKRGERQTVRDHLPPDAQRFFAHDRQWLSAQAKEVGVACTQLIDRLLSDKIVERLRAAQGVISLGETYGHPRLEAVEVK